MDEQENRVLQGLAEFELRQLASAEAAVESAQVKVERQKAHLDGAKQALTDAKEDLRIAKERSRDASAAVKNLPNTATAGESVQADAGLAEIVSEAP